MIQAKCYYKKEMFKKHQQELDILFLANAKSDALKDLLSKHKRMLERIKHERLIHLLVTLFVGFVLTAFYALFLITKNTALLFPLVLVQALFLGYLVHYRYLENTTQNWYKVEDQLIDKLT